MMQKMNLAFILDLNRQNVLIERYSSKKVKGEDINWYCWFSTLFHRDN
jgi:hypothetical protein